MSSPAKLPRAETEDTLASIVDHLGVAADLLGELEDDPDWVVWNAGGAPFGRPEFPGPAGFPADSLTQRVTWWRDALVKVQDSFEHRRRKEAERAQARAAARTVTE